MRVLVACEYSGIVRDAFATKGHDAWSCDLLPSDAPGNHIQADAREVISKDHWDLLIAHPPCRYISVSGIHWNGRVAGRAEETSKALELFRFFLDAHVERICVENPVGVASTRIQRPTQYIQPYDFGEDASKRTGLWLRNLPLLVPTIRARPRVVVWEGRSVERWSNQTDSGQNNLHPTPDRWKLRSKTYRGIADAMAAQWG